MAEQLLTSRLVDADEWTDDHRALRDDRERREGGVGECTPQWLERVVVTEDVDGWPLETATRRTAVIRGRRKGRAGKRRPLPGGHDG